MHAVWLAVSSGLRDFLLGCRGIHFDASFFSDMLRLLSVPSGVPGIRYVPLYLVFKNVIVGGVAVFGCRCLQQTDPSS